MPPKKKAAPVAKPSEDRTAIEDRQPDQIADYHKKHPTLKNVPEKPAGDQD